MTNEGFSRDYINEKKVVLAYIKQRLGNSNGLQTDLDIYQETWLRYIKLSQKTDFKLNVKLSTLLIGIAENVIKEGFRQKTFDLLDDDAFAIFLEYEDTLESKLRAEALLEKLEENLKQLAERCHNIIDLFYFKSYSHKEIKEMLGFNSPEVSRVTLSRCIDSLRKISFN
jgi:RNA polymerase sigma factor (sigma-70 family)